MIVRFLGTGTSTGVPQIGCNCRVCRSSDEKDKRLRSSVRIEVDGKVFLIDCTPDFRQQMMPLPFTKIDGVLFTHEHYDHVGGIDDLRPFSRFGSIELYMEQRVEEALYQRMPYCFAEHKYEGVPDLKIHRIDDTLSPFYIGDTPIILLRALHYHLPILGFRIHNFAYLTDVKSIPDEEFSKLKELEVLVVSALRKQEHVSHQNLAQAIRVAERVGAKHTFFTHISHDMGLHAEVETELPSFASLAYDGLELEILDAYSTNLDTGKKTSGKM
ncbi:MBL fold metallo-hydrolase [Limibacterium fermenti]|uniref:MBL fold metallo-hydrolase n=1 Tax=Limibacterium fermenti TaxID=3229863 RepID=UPI000E84EEE5|nr:MBL fold metallo-hydrolase [Porphyromonadaceae bacterium]HBX44368.1 MBL fold metallo-hydrolase [Porphyromonadaceae bacterium]